MRVPAAQRLAQKRSCRRLRGHKYALRNYAECGPVIGHSRCPGGSGSARSEPFKRRYLYLAALFRHLFSNIINAARRFVLAYVSC